MTEVDNASAGAATTTEVGKTFTQDQLDHIVGERVAKERAKYGDYNDLKSAAQKLAEIEASKKSEVERLTTERDGVKTEAQRTAEENMRLRVALEKGIPAELIDRLRGGTKEELESDADQLLELVKPTPGLDGGTRQVVAGDGDMNALLRSAAGRT